jgi:hypothetical protein
MAMNKEELAEVKGVVRRALEESMEMYQEQWVNAETLCKECQMFTRDWLSKYGEVLGAQRARVMVDGKWVETKGMAYPLHRIKKMIHSGEIRRLAMRDSNRMPNVLDYGGLLVGY